jgi:hypothetical protein
MHFMTTNTYHFARVSRNEMWNSFARPCLVTCHDCNVEHMLNLDNSIKFLLFTSCISAFILIET